LLHYGSLSRGSCSFKFENIWLKEKGFEDLVKQWWGFVSGSRYSLLPFG
jgi:hypothetical protein